MLTLNSVHYKEDLYVDVGKEKKPFLALIAQLIQRGVEARLRLSKNDLRTIDEGG